MLGAIAGDIIGSVYEFSNTSDKRFDLFTARSEFTDDTVLTVAVADALMRGEPYPFKEKIRRWALAYPHRGYGGRFQKWMHSSDDQPYGSFGNGSAMRVSPVGFAFGDETQTLAVAEQSATVTHNHPEGFKGAQAVALTQFLARRKASKETISERIQRDYGYDLSKPISEIRKHYRFNETCQGSVPQAIRAFLESEDYEDAIRLAIWLGGDSDTIACIAGGIAEAFYGRVPKAIESETLRRLPQEMKDVINRFYAWKPG
ncbi:MAG TPA: ADP-ribosylglycohydrolase family protein [Thermotogota bacterium]|nr:ADP-ribosylglycohydrolase family protein [Thermotogota bacterium]HNT96502.1 ADP-ribosylglycohydrolase family protein [Thermotogota bacterium]HQN22806.1 ADP-ribosylglycohydrolase family protein [Thermotogota bacterium]